MGAPPPGGLYYGSSGTFLPVKGLNSHGYCVFQGGDPGLPRF
jgi:hypothetical protein